MQLIDTHCHLTFKVFKKDVGGVLERAATVGVEKMLTVGTHLGNSAEAVGLALEHKNVLAAVGVHPHHVFEFYQKFILANPEANSDRHQEVASQQAAEVVKSLKQLIDRGGSRVVAVGEIGFDKHIYGLTKYADLKITDDYLIWQRVFLEAQLEMAVNFGRAVLIHNREAVEELLNVLTSHKWAGRIKRLVLHCCEPDERLLDLAVANDWFIGVDGDVTYSADKAEFISHVPLERLVLETDAPYLLPEPERGAKKNLPFKDRVCEPRHVVLTATKVANIKGVSLEQVAETTTQNAQRLLGIE